VYVYYNTSLIFYNEIFSEKKFRENQNTHFVFLIFFSESRAMNVI